MEGSVDLWGRSGIWDLGSEIDLGSNIVYDYQISLNTYIPHDSSQTTDNL